MAHFNKISAKPYNLNCFTQQFGLLQGVPIPYQYVVGLEERPSFYPLEIDKLVATNNNKLSQFQFKPFVVSLEATLEYAKWWRSIFTRAFTSSTEYYLSKLVGGSHGKSVQPPRPITSKVAIQTSSKPACKSNSITIKSKYLNLLFS